MVQIGVAARIFVLLVIVLGIYLALPNLWPQAERLDLDQRPVRSWIPATLPASPQDDPAELAHLVDEFAIDVGEAELPQTYFLGPAPAGAERVILLDGREVPLEGSTIARDCTVPSPLVCRQINLGLDLQGGVFASYQIDEQGYFRDLFLDERRAIESLDSGDDPRFFDLLLGDLDLIEADDGGWIGRFNILADVNPADIERAHRAQPGVQIFTSPTGDSPTRGIVLQVSGQVRDGIMVSMTDRLIESLRTRFDAFGVTEPIIRTAGPPGRVYVEIAGADNIPPVTRGELQFCSVPTDFSGTLDPQPQYNYLDATTPGSRDVRGARRVAIDRTVPCVESEDIVGAAAAFGETAAPQVNVQLRPSAQALMNRLTKREWSEGPQARFLGVILDGKVLRFDSFEPNLGTSFRIRGVQTIEEATTLATILRAGALPAEITKLEESKVGPELGAAAIQAGQFAAVLAVVAVLVYMAISYGLFGLFANLALVINLMLILGIMTLLGFTLSLPGIAGIILTVGMAVDANVLVFERMREVWRKTKNVGQAIENGYAQALSTILDANVTTFIAALVLFFIGKGAIQGFAITLSIGIITSVFSALLFTRMLIGFWFDAGRRVEMPI